MHREHILQLSRGAEGDDIPLFVRVLDVKGGRGRELVDTSKL
jgi:hypothetical protein